MNKPLQTNPIKLSQPMGALLCFLGIKNCMPLMHGAQGCASFSKVFFTRHFSDPIAVQTTAVNDITAVIDGGDYSISEAVKNITKKVKPDLVGLFTTGMTETKGDDIKGATFLLKDTQLMSYVHTPDFEGGLESGFAKSIEAIIEQLVEPKDEIDMQKALLIPNVNLTPIEVEKIKEEISSFGFETFALPDLSESLDGHLGVKQGALSSGGISVEEIKNLGDSALVITVGDSVCKAGEKFRDKNPKSTHLHFNTLSGLLHVDKFYKALMDFKHISKPKPSVVRWRKRLQDALLDTHFALGGTDVVLALEADQALSIATTIKEAGANIKAIVIPTKTTALDELDCENIIVGDFEDVEKELQEADLLISNFHGERIAHKYKKALVLRGYPNYETVGNQLVNDTLYEGSCYMLFEVANTINSL
ncbi:nitrogenase iron-molybdenum cofactor biosynthesis protein NifN [Candidatus Sulfurimonas baltica]|uniref:Nitrogenase iron-molybdenum cofactor biosynthesis protein NifN n=1 Tax=Candidatus Sulfurimonas baltica TaxID=2740404 RepID=A0A7S7LX84_9BACT|nr:nitrogenase iron-molybdenum cofactor biosynthesis protein NifN [Candidatus Sulfurimonas baltica]QOY53131.1 nitrogenase iron-molybdenum cofactor biosynthesis protein NifN [Candidatus Sulfurimonas baltica]